MLQNEISCVDYIASQAKRNGMIVIYNPSPYNERAAKVNLNCVDFLFINEIEGEYISQQSKPDQIVQFIHDNYPNLNIILTLGEKGSLYMDKNGSQIKAGVFKTNTIDTTAAGDTYTGYFAANMNTSIKKAMEYAKIASGISVSREGSSISIPSKEEVEKILKISG